MQAIQPILLGLGLLFAGNDAVDPSLPDLAHLPEKLHNRQHPHGQSQAALLLVQSNLDGAEKAVREGLRGVENVEVFLALAAAVRMRQDRRFLDELFEAALRAADPSSAKPRGEPWPEWRILASWRGLRQLADDEGADLEARQTALWTLGRCGTKEAARCLLERLRGDNELFRRAAAAALHDLSGQDYGVDVGRWQGWWENHRTLSNRALAGIALGLSEQPGAPPGGRPDSRRGQLLRLQQQLYSRLSGNERVSHIQSLLDQDDPVVRTLAVTWSVELLPTAEAVAQAIADASASAT